MILGTDQKLEEQVLEKLASHPLTAEELFEYFKKDFTLRAVYKVLEKMEKEGVVLKRKKKYYLHFSWVLRLNNLAVEAKSFYLKFPKNILDFENKKRQIWHFRDLYKLNSFWGDLLLLLLDESKDKRLFGWNPHPWFHLLQTKQEEQYIKAIKAAGGGLYLIVGGRTFLDHWAEKFWDKKAVEYSFALSPFQKEKQTYINVIGDTVIRVKLDSDITKKIENLYQQTKSSKELNIGEIISIFRTQVRASIWLERNPVKAKILRRRFIKFFGLK